MKMPSGRNQGKGFVLLAVVLALTAAAIPTEAGGPKMSAATKYNWKDLWRGHGPAGSPTGAPPGLTVVYSKEAWRRVITAFGPPYEKHNDLSVDWTKDLILFVQANEDNPDTEVRLKALSRTGKTVAIDAVLHAGPQGRPSLGVELRPWIIASAPAALLADNPQVSFTIDGRELPVTHER